MHRGGLSLTFLLTCFLGAAALADDMSSGWAFTLSCPNYDQSGGNGTLTVSNPNGFACTGGCGICQRQAGNRFQSLSFSGESLPGGASLTASTLYALNVGKFLFVPPVLNTDTNPIFTVASQCNNYTGNVNYLFLQIDAASLPAIKTSHIWGNSTLSPASTTLTANYDINGTQTWSGSVSLPINSCSGGVYSVSGSGDFDATMYTGNDWSGLYKTPGHATLFLPRTALNQNYLGALTYTGVLFSSGTPSSVQNVHVISNAGGSTFTIYPYTNVSTDTWSPATSDVITISSVNSPFNGGMKGTVTRNGTGSGRVVCLANQGGGLDGEMIACSGEDPLDNSVPYSVIFSYKPSAGTLETLLNGSGQIVTQVSSNSTQYSESNAVAIDSSGKIVAAGYAQDGLGYQNFAIARYNADGTPDTTFNTTGNIRTQVSLTTLNSEGWGVAVDSANRIIEVGNAADASGHFGFAVVRYNTDGSLDTTFNGNGDVFTQLSNAPTPSSQAYAVAIDGSGKIVAAGFANDASNYRGFALARYNTDGSLDTTLNSTGKIFTQLSTYSTPFSQANAVAIDGSGKIVAAGRAADASNHTGFAVARYNSDGSLDTNFNGTGKVFTQLSVAGNPASYVNAVAIDGAGKVVAAGAANDSGGIQFFALARYSTDGSLDTTFNGTGKVAIQVSATANDSYANGVAIDSSGRILVAGRATDATFSYDIAVLRFNTDGSLDTFFNGTGEDLIQISTNSYGNGISLDSSGRIVVTGYGTDASGYDSFGVIRLVP